MPVLQQPEAYVGGAANLFGPKGELVNEATKTFFKSFMDAFGAMVERTLG